MGFSVQTGAINVVSKILDIAIYILTKLVIDEIWIQAYKLLEILQICNVYHDAAFVILSAEIYLANNEVIKAFMLLKRKFIINYKNSNIKHLIQSCIEPDATNQIKILSIIQ